MPLRVCAAIITSLAALGAIRAADIDGTIIIKRKLSKRTITASASSYTRGAAVQLEADPDQDPLDFERAHVVIYLEGSLPSRPETAMLEQKNRRFTPDLLVIPAGSKVSFPNEDTIFHNVFSLSKPKSFDLGNYPKGQTRLVTFPEPGIVFVNCHLHPNMGAVIFVTPNRWSTRADASGQFRLTDVPPGNYTVVAWHKAVGFFRQKVHVDNRNASAVEFFIPFESNMSAHNDQR
jgi:plastocyanin